MKENSHEQNFNPLDAFQVNRQVQVVMTGLWVGNIDAIEENQGLVICSSADADVGLGSKRSPLADIYRRNVPEKIVDIQCRRPFVFLHRKTDPGTKILIPTVNKRFSQYSKRPYLSEFVPLL